MEDTQFDVSPEQMETIARKMLKASDSYAKMDVLDDVVDWGDRIPFVWHMIEQGVYPAWEDPAIWYELADSVDQVTGEQIASFLAKVESYVPAAVESDGEEDATDSGYDDYDEYGGGYDYGGYDYGGGGMPAYETPMFVSYWPQHLDNLVFEAYANDPAPFEARMSEFSDDVKKGLELVAFRAGKNPNPPDGMLQELATLQGGDHGLPWAIKAIENGEIIDFELGEADNLRAFVEQFGTWEDWGRALLDVVMAAEYPPGFERLDGVWEVANTDELQHLLAEVSVYGNNAASVVEHLLERSETVEELYALGRNLADDNRERGAEIAATAALLVAERDGVDVPDGIEELIQFDMYGSPMNRSGYEAVELFSKALWAIPAPRLEARIKQLFDGEYTKHKPFPALRVARRRGLAVLDDAIAAMRAVNGDSQTFHGLRSKVVGLSWLPLDDVDRILAEVDAPGTPAMKDAFHRAALGILADAETLDPKYDDVVSYVDWRDPAIDANDLTNYVYSDVHAIVGSLDEDRAAAILQRDATSEGTWARVFAGLAKRPIETVLDVAMTRLAKDGIGAERVLFEDLLRSQPEAVKPRLGAVLAAQADPDFHNSIKRCIGEQEYEAILADSGVESAADKGPADKIRRLSETYFAANPEASRVRVTVFERADEAAAPNAIGRIGGRPFGLTADTWPCKNGDTDEPMQHLVTIDVAHAPSLQGNEGVRAIAVFCHSPNHNEAWNPNNPSTHVMMLSEEDVSKGPYEGELPAGTDDAVGIIAHALEVPADCFSVAYGTDAELEAIKGAIYQTNAWSGPIPIWLQSDEYWGNFLFQFDEGFVYMNLGDMGVMYVFDDTAFWQCH